METYEEFINNILESRGRFACGDEYHERHHIMPKCIGGINDEDNLIDLYAKEHFIAHKLLTQENPNNNKLAYAYLCMAFVKNENHERYEITPEEYEEARKACSQAAKQRFSNPSNHPNYGKHLSQDTKRKISEAHKNPSEETRKKNSNAHKKENLSIETLQKMKQSALERFENPENHPMYGKHHSQETKNKIKEATKSRVGDKHPMWGKHWSEEIKRKNSEAHKGLGVGADNPRAISVVCLETGQVYGAASIASNELGICASSIRSCCLGKLKTAGGFHWANYNDDLET